MKREFKVLIFLVSVLFLAFLIQVFLNVRKVTVPFMLMILHIANIVVTIRLLGKKSNLNSVLKWLWFITVFFLPIFGFMAYTFLEERDGIGIRDKKNQKIA